MFADAHSFSVGEKKVELVRDNETASVFRAFLKLASEGVVDRDIYLTGIVNLALFLNKWDCPGVLANLLCAVQLRLKNGAACPLSAFEVAAAIDDEETARAALSIRRWEWAKRDGAPNGIPSRPVLDPRGWSLWHWRDISNADYIFALIRAYDDVGDTNELVDKFAEYLAAAKAVPR